MRCVRCDSPVFDDDQGLYSQVPVTDPEMPGFTFMDRAHECGDPPKPHQRPVSIPAVPDARRYDGYRHCLYGRESAKWDIAGFRACDYGEHIGRAAEAQAARREQEGGE